ncbi:MAG: 16S rRNA (guanine(966)-N(2))-methyltransferase RsmD [Pseudomonadota bacterium]
MSGKGTPAPGRAGANRFRIIGGRHRGRRLSFPAVEGLRPSPDRVRETLFNWLGPTIVGARCVDLFAGSGALGLEALSRDAAEVVFVDRSSTAVQAIRHHLQALASDRGSVRCEPAETFLAATPPLADLYFVDPPFDGHHWDPLCTLLDERRMACAPALVYLEHPRSVEIALPPAWESLKRSRAGNVAFQLVRTGAVAETE